MEESTNQNQVIQTGRNFRRCVCVLLMLFAFTSCASGRITSTDVQQPVLLADVNKLRDSGNIQEFDIEISTTSEGQYATYPHIEGTMKADAELQKRISSRKDRVIIEEIYFSYSIFIMSFVFGGVGIETSTIGVKGAVLKAGPDKNANEYVEGELH